MDFRIGYRRPLRTVSLLRQQRQRIWLCVVAALALTATATAMNWPDAPPVAQAVATSPLGLRLGLGSGSVTPVKAMAARPVYPYSIVPGGVATREDVAQRVRTDAVVARHYASFDITKAHPAKVTKARAVHVSYRKGDKVYWTAKTVMLAAGETVLTDGTSEIRGRCGNRISDHAQLPVAMNEPTEQELDSSMNVAMDPDDAGGLQNASFALDDALPSTSATQSQQLAGYSQSDAAPATPLTKSSMPAMPTFSNGITNLGMEPTRYLAVAASPTVALGPTTEGASTVLPAASASIPATALTLAPVAASPAAAAAGSPAPTVLAFTVPVAQDYTAVSLGATEAPGATADTTALVTAAAVTADKVTTYAAATAAVARPVGTEAQAPASATGTPAAAGPVASTGSAAGLPAKAALAQGDVPEPATLWLSGAAFAAMLLARRRTRGRKAHTTGA